MVGTIRERSPGHFELRVFNPATNKQVTRTYVSPRGEKGGGIRAARKELARLVTGVEKGEFGGSNATFSHLLDEWIRLAGTLGRSPNTIHGYEAKAKRIKAGPLGDKTVSRLTTRDIDAYYMQLVSEGMTPATLAHYHRIVRAALNQAERWEWVNRNVARQATLGTAQRSEMHVPTVEQARALVIRAAETTSPDLGPILLFAMLTGMRRGELCGVQWGDIDWLEQRVTVRRSVWQVRSTWGVKDPKTHQVRTIALDDVAVSLLAARRARSELDATGAGVVLGDAAFVWSNSGQRARRRGRRTASPGPSTGYARRWSRRRAPPGRSGSTICGIYRPPRWWGRGWIPGRLRAASATLTRA